MKMHDKDVIQTAISILSATIITSHEDVHIYIYLLPVLLPAAICFLLSTSLGHMNDASSLPFCMLNSYIPNPFLDFALHTKKRFLSSSTLPYSDLGFYSKSVPLSPLL